MKSQYFSLNKSACVVCSEPQTFYDSGALSAERSAFFGAPEGRFISFTLCEKHINECLRGTGTPSGFPNAALLEDSIKNAVAAYDYSDEDAEEKRVNDEIQEAISAAKNLIKAGRINQAFQTARQAAATVENEALDSVYGAELWPLLARLYRQAEVKGDTNAVMYTRKAAEAAAATGNNALAAEMNVELGAALVDSMQPGAALSTLRETIAYFEKQDRKNPLHVKALHTCGIAHSELNQTQQAVEFFARADALSGKKKAA